MAKSDIRLPDIKLPLGVEGQIASKHVESKVLHLHFKVNEFSSHEDIDRTLKSIHRQVADIVAKEKLDLDIQLKPLTAVDSDSANNGKDTTVLGSLTAKDGEDSPTIENHIDVDLVAYAEKVMQKRKISTGDISQFIKQVDTQTIEIANDFQGDYADLPKNTCERLSVLIETLLTEKSPIKNIQLNSVVYTAENKATTAINDFMQHVASTRGEFANKLIAGSISEKRVEQSVNRVKARSCAKALSLTQATK